MDVRCLAQPHSLEISGCRFRFRSPRSNVDALRPDPPELDGRNGRRTRAVVDGRPRPANQCSGQRSDRRCLVRPWVVELGSAAHVLLTAG
jgi:hypothetical protein